MFAKSATLLQLDYNFGGKSQNHRKHHEKNKKGNISSPQSNIQKKNLQ